MFPGYEDVTSRINEAPTWWTAEGYPRYGAFKPRESNIYARYSTLMMTQCQGCYTPFLIGEDWGDFDTLLFALDTDRMTDEEKKHIHPREGETEVWLTLQRGLYAPHKKGEDGENIYKHLTIEEIVKNWGFGDPPNVGCCAAGATMSSMPRVSVQVWDGNFGRETEERTWENGAKGRVITKWGEPKRLTELEGLDVQRGWMPPADQLGPVPEIPELMR